MKTLQLQKDLYWIGALDPDLRIFDIIMRTEFGTTYNAYFLRGSEKTALFETVKAGFADGYFEALNDLGGTGKADYLIVSHTEPDHAGSVERLLDANPGLTVVGTRAAIGFLEQIVNRKFPSLIVKDNDTLSLGDKTLRFFALPNLHWPDTMFTYVEEDQTLVTCDAFGAHYAHPSVLRSAVTNVDGYLSAAKYYFDNILGPFKRPFVQRALDRVRDLPLAMICTGHGPVLDSHIPELLALYQSWCEPPAKTKKSVVIPYVSAYGYTASLAGAVAEGIRGAGDIDVRLYDMTQADAADVLADMAGADGILFGTPTILGDALAPIMALTAHMPPPVYGGKRGGAFGSYGWTGEGVPNLVARLRQIGIKVEGDGFRVRFKPTEEDLRAARAYGEAFAEAL